jgi:hypothetical protein
MQKHRTYMDGKHADAASGKWPDSCNLYPGAATGKPFVLR